MHARPPSGPRDDPLRETDRLLVDGNNLLHVISASTTPAPRSALVSGLRGAIPDSIPIEVVFDGPASGGLAGDRIATRLRVRYSGRRSADAVLLGMVDETGVRDGPAGTGAILVVTDDADLRRRLRSKGARTVGASWLLARIERLRATGAPGGSRSTISPAPIDAADPDDDVPRWEPGRRATVKKGNAHRRRRRATDGRR